MSQPIIGSPVEIQVEAERWKAPLAVPSSPLFFPLDAAATEPGVQVQRQGSGAPQTDLRIRGSPFSSAGFTLHGLPLSNPQTEHFNADLPLPASWISSLSLETGLDAFRRTPGHLSGTLATELAEPDSRRLFTFLVGGAGWIGFGSDVAVAHDSDGDEKRGMAAFVSADRMDRTDGHPDNHLERWAGGLHAADVSPIKNHRFDALVLWSDRTFGARGFYGAPPSFPAEEKVQTVLAFAGWSQNDGNAPARVSACWAHQRDQYRLDRFDPGLYENRHRTHTPSIHADTGPRLTDRWRIWLRSDAALESIRSDYSGRFPSTGLGHHDRGRFSVAAIPEYTPGLWQFSAGGSAAVFENDRPSWHPALGIARNWDGGHKLFTSLTGASRQPSFTELNYESPGSLGNRNLHRQESLLWEGGYRYHKGDTQTFLVLFCEESRNTVDWIRNSSDDRWRAENLGRIQTLGAHLAGSFSPANGLTFSAEYLALEKNCDAEPFASRYALDYAPHWLRAAIGWRPVSWGGLTFRQILGRYRPNPARMGTRTDSSAGLELNFNLERLHTLLKAGVMNLWDSDFQTFPGQPPAGREWYLAAVFLL